MIETFNEEEYKKVDRNPQVGDLVVVVELEDSFGDYEVGEIFTVIEILGRQVYTDIQNERPNAVSFMWREEISVVGKI